MSTIQAPKIKVLMTDGQEHTIKLSYRAQMQYGRTARVRKWPAADKAPELATNFMLWFVLCQVEGIYDYEYEDFENHVEWVEELDKEDLTEEDEDFPTKRATSDEL